MSSPFSDVTAIALAAAAFYLLRRALSSKPAPLPPGPKGWPLLGNLFDWPSEKEWETFTRWGDTYGDIVYANLAGQPVVVLNDFQLAVDMLDRKGAVYSDRPFMHMSCELVGWKHSFTLMPYGGPMREQRNLVMQAIGSKAILGQFEPMEEVEVQQFVRRLLDEPERLEFHVRKLAGAIILNITYGYQVKEGDDPLVALATKLVDEFSDAITPGRYMVDALPIVDRLPSWFPGLGYRKVAAKMRQTRDEFLNIPFRFVQEQLAAGTARQSFVSANLEKKDADPRHERLIKWTSVALYGGGSDTTVSAICTFFLAMSLYPRVQACAQAEIDEIIGQERLPKLSDRQNLSYVEALVTEVLRWGQILPQGVPHTLREDDMHAGYCLSKGTTVIANIWKFTHDPRTYKDPGSFEPKRFLKTATHEPEPDPRQFVFGFGRRICPGQHLADQSLWLTCAGALAALTISKKRGPDGRPIEPAVEYRGHTVTHPKDFPCAIGPRSAKLEALVRESADSLM